MFGTGKSTETESSLVLMRARAGGGGKWGVTPSRQETSCRDELALQVTMVMVAGFCEDSKNH